MSTPITDGGPAFPVDHKFLRQTASLAEIKIACGMTLRDYFAGQALAGVSANPEPGLDSDEDAASWCYHIADAMIAARDRKGGEA
jgi:hypothetical protein